MTNTDRSRLTQLSIVFAAGVALVATVDIANARGNHNGNTQSTNVTPHFVITGQPASVKRVLPDHKDSKERHADKKKKDCAKITVPTQGCAISPNDPVGSVHTGGITGGPAPKGPSPAATPVALSNGVTKSVIENGKGLTVTSNSPGTITVSNGTSSVTMAGGSLTLHGAQSVAAASGLQLVHLANGDVSVAVSPVLMGASSKSAPVPPGVGLKDDLKAAGGFTGSIVGFPAIAVATVAMAPVAAVTGLAAGDVKGSFKDLGDFSASAGKWITSWF